MFLEYVAYTNCQLNMYKHQICNLFSVSVEESGVTLSLMKQSFCLVTKNEMCVYRL